MSNKVYAVLLVLAGIVGGVLVVSLSSSPAAAKLPTDERIIVQPGLNTVPSTVRPVVAPVNIRVYPVGVTERGQGIAYVVKDGKLWHCEGTTAREVNFR